MIEFLLEKLAMLSILNVFLQDMYYVQYNQARTDFFGNEIVSRYVPV